MQEANRLSFFGNIVNLFFIVVSVLMIMPIVLLVITSISSEQSILNYGYKFIPNEISFAAYEHIFKVPGQILRAYGVTIFVTVVGTLMSLLFTAMLAYVIARRDYPFRKSTTIFVFFTMMFSGGLVPTYILITQYLHLKDSIWVLILPMVLSPFMVMVLKGFFSKLPFELFESAEIDGAGEWRIFFQLVLPLSTPALATAAVIISFQFWNDWWLAFLFMDDRSLTPLQLLLIRILNNITFVQEHMQEVGVDLSVGQLPATATRMSLTVLVAGPMLIVFPFFQKYFVKGLTLGSLK
jgi:putative aldouronate transport system permease protein